MGFRPRYGSQPRQILSGTQHIWYRPKHWRNYVLQVTNRGTAQSCTTSRLWLCIVGEPAWADAGSWYCTILTKCSDMCHSQKKNATFKIHHKSKDSLLAFLETEILKIANTWSKWYSTHILRLFCSPFHIFQIRWQEWQEWLGTRSRDVNRTVYGYSHTPYGNYTASNRTIY
jgi:hypothetical protein